MEISMLDANLTIAKAVPFYKDEDLVKSCRKTIGQMEGNQRKETYPDIAGQYISFIRLYPPMDLVTPLKKDND